MREEIRQGQRQKQRENKRRQKQRIMEQAHNGQSSTNLCPANTREVGPQLRDSEGVVWWWGGKKESILGFKPKLLLGKCLARVVFCLKK